MKKFLKNLLGFLALCILIWFGFKYFGKSVPEPAKVEKSVQGLVDAIKHATGKTQPVTKRVSAPPPLRVPAAASGSTLSVAGDLTWTNINRAQNGGLPALTLNVELTAAAQAKLNDLFAKQYFEHVSPTGVGPGDLAKAAGYDYINEGENLALGNFDGDQALVTAWMNSPGHRANILCSCYTEIGIAVGKGTYEGRTTWIAVQEFGRPVTACPQVDAALKAKLDADEAAANSLEAEAAQRQAEIQAAPKPHDQEELDAYNAKVDAYNALVRQLNALVAQIQGEIAVYNGQVQAYNACAAS